MLNQPLLEENLNDLDENVNWRNRDSTPTRGMNRDREHSGSSNNLLHTLPSGDLSPDSKRISNRLLGTKIKAKGSFKGRRKKAATAEY